MKILLLAGLMILGLALCCFLWGCQEQQRGLHGEIFVSNGRPALAVTPDSGLHLWSAGWCDVAPDTRTSEQGSAKVWYALYARDTQDTVQSGRLLVVLTEGQGKWSWPFELNAPREVLRKAQTTQGKMTIYCETILQPAATDPWATAWDTRWDDGILVRRFRIFFMQRQVKLVLEYREPVATGRPLPVVMDMPLLAAFEERAEAAFTLSLRDDGASIPAVEQRLDLAPKTISRRQLASWLGEMYQRGDINH